MTLGSAQASYCLSEADAGSDVAAIRCRAARDGQHYVLNGTKQWITNAGISDTFTVFAKTDPDVGHRGISCFLVEADWGVTVARHESKMGLRGSPTGEIHLEDVRVPAQNLVGYEGDGVSHRHALTRPQPTDHRCTGRWHCPGRYRLRRRVYEAETCVRVPIAELQGLRFMLADMVMRTEAARAWVYRSCAMVDDDPTGQLSEFGAMAKCFASDAAMAVTTDAVHLLGGNGYTTDFPAERFMRDAKITQIYEGTNQIQRVVIAKKVLG